MKKTISYIILLTCFMHGAFYAQESGPLYVKNVLTNQGVFNTPTYSFTTDYDAYKEHDNIHGMFIDAFDYEGHATKVFSWYGVPETLQSGEKAPAVVLVHGGGGTAFPNWVKQWTDRGYIAIAIAHEGQLPGAKDPWYPTWEYSGPRRAGFFRDADEAIGEQWFYHATADAILANSLLRSFPEVDDTNIGINGISWGGILTNVITGIDQRFKFSVPVYGCGFLYDSPHYSQDLLVMSEAEKAFYYANWEPSLYIPLQTMPVFYVNGNNDKQFAMNIATPSYKLMPSEKYLRIEHRMSHSTVAGYAPLEIYNFADYITKGSIAPISVSVDNETDNNVTASYVGTIKSAVLYYTTDVVNWEQNSYNWLEVDAQINEATNQITVELPDYTKYYYLNVMTNESLMYSSPMEEVVQEVPESSTTFEVTIQAEENTTYPIGVVTMTGVGMIPGYDVTFEIDITVTPNGDFTGYPNATIVSGVSDNNGTSSAKGWGISDDGINDAAGDRIFIGEQEFTATISDARVGTITGTSGLMPDNITIDTFKSITITNGHSTGDRFTFSADGSADFELGRFNSEPLKVVDLVTEAADTQIESFTIKNGSVASNDKWAVENIKVQVTVDVSTLGVNDVLVYKNKSLVLFPNPVKNTVSFNIESVKTEIFDITGKLAKMDAKRRRKLDISDLIKGLYIVKVCTSQGKVFFNKMLKK